MTSIIKIGTMGHILQGKYAGWFILIEEAAVDTGCYLIYLFDQLEPSRRTEGFDHWAESLDVVDKIFKEYKWEIHWLGIKESEIVDA